MPRTLTPERQSAAVAFWQTQLTPILARTSVTMAALVSSLAPNIPPASSDQTRNLDLAARRLAAALKRPEPERGHAIGEWVLAHLVTKGSSLLITESKRKAALASVRNVDRRTREKQQLGRMRLIRVPATTVAKFRAFKEAMKFKTEGEALDALLSTPKGRGRAPATTPAPSRTLFDPVSEPLAR